MNIKAILPKAAFPSVHSAWKQYQPNASPPLLPIGAAEVDRRLHGGIVQAGLHEFFGGAKADSYAAAAFALLLAWRLPDSDAGIFWITGDKERQTSGRLYPLGLSAMGGHRGYGWSKPPTCVTPFGQQPTLSGQRRRARSYWKRMAMRVWWT
jgi:hypothetical protein